MVTAINRNHTPALRLYSHVARRTHGRVVCILPCGGSFFVFSPIQEAFNHVILVTDVCDSTVRPSIASQNTYITNAVPEPRHLWVRGPRLPVFIAAETIERVD